MCVTCNYKNYTLNNTNPKDVYLEQDIGLGNLIILCEPNGRHYKIAVKDDMKSAFVIYRCPTCGKNLF